VMASAQRERGVGGQREARNTTCCRRRLASRPSRAWRKVERRFREDSEVSPALQGHTRRSTQKETPWRRKPAAWR